MAKVLVANKCDKPDKVVESEMGRQLAEEFKLDFFETSAKNGCNVNEAFNKIANVIIRDKMPLNGFPGSKAGMTQGHVLDNRQSDLTNEGKDSSTCCK